MLQPTVNLVGLQPLQTILLSWWQARFPQGPTACQKLAWPAIFNGQNLLLTAPTGTGKTLAALIPIYQELINRPHRDNRGIACLYIAPLKALSNDLHVRLQDDAETLARYGTLRMTVGLRTGDVSTAARRQLLDDPPDILLTTPESLSLMLVHPESARVLQDVRWVIVDEVHALACNKRGSDLSISLERLDHLTAKPAQRIGLSATCHPLQKVARWLGGSKHEVVIRSVQDQIRWRLDIVDLTQAMLEQSFLPSLQQRLQHLIEKHRTVLVFTNVRSLAERLGWSLKRRLPHLAEQIGVHHGSIARQERHEVERKLQRGELRVVLSSTSLELGIDIGCIDHVAFVHAPGGAGRLLQRVGRGNHRPGCIKTGTLFVGSAIELLEAVATRAAAEDGFLEPLHIPAVPLDVLCQQLVAMAVVKDYSVRQAYDLIRRAACFEHLELIDFVRCLEYLSGGNAQLNIPPRIRIRDHRLLAGSGIIPRLYRTNAGTINDEPHRQVYLEQPKSDEPARSLGSVPNHFADRLLAGDRFLLSGKVYELCRHERTSVVVKESGGLPAFTRWQGGIMNMPPILAERFWTLRARIGDALIDSPEHARQILQEEYQLPDDVTEPLIEWMNKQIQVSEVPDSGLLVEAAASPDGEHVSYSFHVPLPAAACEGLARVLSWRICAGTQYPMEPGPLGFLMTLPADVEITPGRLRILLSPEGYDIDLQRVLAGSPVLARRFIETAHNGLMLLRKPLRGKHRRVGGTSWAGDKLMNWLRFANHDFPLLHQAQREAAEDYFQSEATQAFLERLQLDEIRLRWLSEPSPFAAEWWPQSSVAPKNSVSSLDQMLLALGTTQQEANHVVSG
ncbi:MAG: DEAD/DEAH box helicase [Planctomycetia bacterium]|nr:DEAD/DEAH box helicase [Planctomycetia bacterium]